MRTPSSEKRQARRQSRMTNLAQSISVGPTPEAARGLLTAANLPSSDLTDAQLTTAFMVKQL